MGAEGARFLGNGWGHASPRNFIFLGSLNPYFYHFHADRFIDNLKATHR